MQNRFTLRRRMVLAAPSLLLAGRRAQAQALPSGTIRLVVGFAAGGGIDAFSRIVARGASQRTGQPFVVENRTGASGTLAAVAVARSAPDGRTVFVADSGSMTITADIMLRPPLDPQRELAPIMLAVHSPQVLVTRSGAIANFPALLDAARKEPGKLTYASAGAGNATHLMIADFARRAGVEFTHVPYRGGGQMATSVLSGETDICLLSLASAVPHLRAGTLIALAVAAERELPELPEVPTILSVVPGAQARAFWYGLNVPAETPPALVAALHDVFHAALTAPETRAAFEPLGIQVVASSPEAYAAFLRVETIRRSEMARAAGIVPE
ncbi:tripartite tricarboxylate transporter substrate binding protein [Roseomonas sp. HJA6]|uniref:Tripartite tricarboxylate transporter substrate binding protein n=1 Tax=Roseomonas alba TaxID=2846776 RepID=A0ABS7AAJ9_9PROT|nr:tripartite tricarboxylate transporter substrate binding protein [Neoroseomonas alba]MBW6399291.1 tripartite tricarboxylate transporter substrate binding protein [Neoroseomonas alba]